MPSSGKGVWHFEQFVLVTGLGVPQDGQFLFLPSVSFEIIFEANRLLLRRRFPNPLVFSGLGSGADAGPGTMIGVAGFGPTDTGTAICAVDLGGVDLGGATDAGATGFDTGIETGFAGLDAAGIAAGLANGVAGCLDVKYHSAKTRGISERPSGPQTK